MESRFIPRAAEVNARLLFVEETTVQDASLEDIMYSFNALKTLLVIFELTTKTLVSELNAKYNRDFARQLFSLKESFERFKKCYDDNKAPIECSDEHSEQARLWQDARFDILSGIANELMCWLGQTSKSLQRVELLRQFLERQRAGLDLSTMDKLIEKAGAEGKNETIQLIKQADSNVGDYSLYRLIRFARESGFNHEFLARESDVANGGFDISVKNLAAYTISLEYLQLKRHHNKKSEEGLCHILDDIREGKFSWKDVEPLGEHESAIVDSAWDASPGSVRILPYNGSKTVKELSEEAKQLQDRTFRDILGRVRKIFAEVGFDL
ncbi:hypothetical protein CSIM01_11770 [Colletotrichum simmondsii]|uniref:Uncharacterized protein n=1 Tax=Colletotrichum simmondsii TaxID=703756 RepID=A0A135SCH5_9PEZI|nr:hypothetical protein CSIM01_11770 [Colletotrichum simmondsii]